MPAITLAGEQLMAGLQAAGQPLIIDRMIFAYIDGLDPNTAVDRSETRPTTNEVADMALTQIGAVDNDTVVYSCVLGSDVGTWMFNWFGLWSSEHDTLVAIAYVPEQEKRATVGIELGNVVTKNFALEFNAAADLTGININAESWQIDYTARLRSMDEHLRQVTQTTYGRSLFQGDAFLPTLGGEGWALTPGEAVLAGLPIHSAEAVPFSTGLLPAKVWLDVYQSVDMASITNTFEVCVGDDLVDYTDGNVQHFLIPIAQIEDTNEVTDLRSAVGESLESWHPGNLKYATKVQAGFLRIATNQETVTGDLDNVAVSPAALKHRLGNVRNTDYIPAGTRMLFQQSNAPTGWVKSTDHDNKALRVVSGSANSGGSNGFTQALNSSKSTSENGGHSHSISVNNHTLSGSQMPNHAHTLGGVRSSSSGGSRNSLTGSGSNPSSVSAGSSYGVHSSGGGSSHSHGASSSSVPNHAHTFNLDVAYVDLIIAVKE